MNLKNIFQIDKNIQFYIKALALLFIISGIFGFITAQQFPLEAGLAMDQAVEELSFVEEMSPWNIFLLITLNNSIKALFIMLMGILWGIIPVLFILINGYAIGIIASVAILKTGLIPVILGVLPHGIIEIPAILLAAGYGVWLGEMFAKKLRNRKIIFGMYIKNAFDKFIKIILPILITAALVETFVTTWTIDAVLF